MALAMYTIIGQVNATAQGLPALPFSAHHMETMHHGHIAAPGYLLNDMHADEEEEEHSSHTMRTWAQPQTQPQINHRTALDMLTRELRSDVSVQGDVISTAVRAFDTQQTQVRGR